ncbi:MAG TPA: long-chain fatty acid--CoA ligase [Capsulimonadaceae bacterium]|jgi:long-chain acyl-CoA synthetase
MTVAAPSLSQSNSKGRSTHCDIKLETDPLPLFRLLDDAARDYPDCPAFDYRGQSITYRTYSAIVERAACGLQGLGLGKGSRVGLVMPNSPYYAIMFFAVLKAGGTVVNFNPSYTDIELVDQMNDSGVSVMVCLDGDSMPAKLSSIIGATSVTSIIVCPQSQAVAVELERAPNTSQVIPFDWLIDNAFSLLEHDIDPMVDAALLQYTGGTTGTAKAAVLTHANLYQNVRQIDIWIAELERGKEVFLAVIPFFHVFALTILLLLGVGTASEIVILDHFEPLTALSTIERKRPTFLAAVPTVFAALCARLRPEGKDLSFIRICISGGAPLPEQVLTDFRALTGCDICEGFGLTECSPVVTVNPIRGTRKSGSIGLPIPGTVVELASLTDRDTILGLGETGELVVSGPQVMAGYLNRPDETEDVLRGSRLYTGDVAFIDADGYVFIMDRIKDMIICGGFKVYPRRVEEAILKHPGVEECIVAGVPARHVGETVKAWIKTKSGVVLTESELKEFLKPYLSAVERPKKFEFRTQPLPRTNIGKLSRRLARLEELETDSKLATSAKQARCPAEDLTTA